MPPSTLPTKNPTYFGGCNYHDTSPKAILPSTKILNVEVTFEEALKLHLAIGECVSKLNSYKRNAPAKGQRVMTLAVHLNAKSVTIHDSPPSKGHF